MSKDVKIGVNADEFYQKLGQFEGEVDQINEEIGKADIEALIAKARTKELKDEISKQRSRVKKQWNALLHFKKEKDKIITNASTSIKEKAMELEFLESRRIYMASRIVSTVQQAYGLFNQVLGIFGESIGGVLGAVISAAFTTATTLMSMAAAQASNPWTAASAVMTLISAALTVTAAIQAEQDKQKIMAEVEATKARVGRPTHARITSTTITVRL